MKRKLMAMLLLLAIALTMFAACGKENSTGVSPDQTTKTPAASSADEKTGGKAEDPPSDIIGSESVVAGGDNIKVNPSPDAKLKIAYTAEPGGMSQPGVPFASNMNPSAIFGETLIGWNASQNTITPKIAASWEWINDLTLRLHLRDDVTSINGDPFTANDVIFTWNWNHSVAGLASYYNMFDYENTKAVDDYTVDIALNNPYPFLTLDLAHTAYTVAVEKSVDAIGGKDACKTDPSALTGPYKLTKWDEGQCVYAERREDYWGTMPYFKYIEMWVITDATTRAMGVEAGDYQLAMNPSTTSALAAEGSTAMKPWFISHAGVAGTFVFNSDTEYLAIKENRQAIALAINYEAQLKVACSDKGELSDSALYSVYNTYYTPASNPDNCFIKYDSNLAKQKLIDAGNPDGFTINCKYRTNEQMIVLSAEMLKNQLGEVGITLELVPMESAAWYTDMRSGNWDTHLSVAANANPKRMITSIDGHRVDHNTATGSCGVNWAPDGIEELIDRCLQTIDDTARMAAFTELNDLCREYVPMVILYCPWKATLTSPKIAGFNLSSMGAVDMGSLYEEGYLG